MASIGGAAIVGAGRFLGAHLVRGFEARRTRVLPVLRAHGEWSPAGARTVDEVAAEPALLEGCDVLIHVAVPPVRRGQDAGDLRATNLQMVERAARLAAAGCVRRLVLVSGVSVYGFPLRLPVSEDHPYAPRTAAAAALVEAEVRARRAARELRLELVIVRPAIVYGPGDTPGLLDEMAGRMRAGTFRVVGAGDNVLHHIHVDDVVEGIWLACVRAEAAGDHFILAGPETTTLVALSELVARSIGRSLPERHVPSVLARALATVVDVAANRGLAFTSGELPINHAKLDDTTLPICFDIARAKRRLGFHPRVGYAEGVARTLRGEWPALARAGAGS
jgi:nucleoside-diphosphate-sugar epimerase